MNKEKLMENWDSLKAETKAQILQLAEKEIEKGWFLPKRREVYYYIDNRLTLDAKPIQTIVEIDFDKTNIEIGNCFRTEKEAIFAGRCDYYTKRFETYVNRHTEKIDWDNDNQVKYNAEWSHFRREIDFADVRCCQMQGTTYASSEQILKDAINDIGEENFLKYVMKVEK